MTKQGKWMRIPTAGLTAEIGEETVAEAEDVTGVAKEEVDDELLEDVNNNTMRDDTADLVARHRHLLPQMKT